jgi:hypothetical protein
LKSNRPLPIHLPSEVNSLQVNQFEKEPLRQWVRQAVCLSKEAHPLTDRALPPLDKPIRILAKVPRALSKPWTESLTMMYRIYSASLNWTRKKVKQSQHLLKVKEKRSSPRVPMWISLTRAKEDWSPHQSIPPSNIAEPAKSQLKWAFNSKRKRKTSRKT